AHQVTTENDNVRRLAVHGIHIAFQLLAFCSEIYMNIANLSDFEPVELGRQFTDRKSNSPNAHPKGVLVHADTTIGRDRAGQDQSHGCLRSEPTLPTLSVLLELAVRRVEQQPAEVNHDEQQRKLHREDHTDPERISQQ